MFNLFSDAKNIFITFLVAATITLYVFLYFANAEVDTLQLKNNLLTQQVAEYSAATIQLKQEADKDEKELRVAEKRAHDIRIKGESKTNSILLEKVSSDCIEANGYLIDKAVEFKGAA